MTIKLKEIAIQDWSEIYDLANTYRQQEQWQAAAIALQQTIELRPDFFWSHHHLGDVLSKLQQWQKAAQAYSEAVKLDPQFFWSWHNLGDVLSRLQQWQKAAQAYSEAVKLDPQFFWSWHNLGDVLSRLQQWDRAIASYLQGIYLQPEHQLSYQKLGTAFKQGDLAQTIKDYRQLIQTPPQNSIFELLHNQPQRLIELANNLVQQHQTYGAIVVHYLILEIQPTNIDVLQSLSQLLKQQSKLEEAIAVNQQQLQQNMDRDKPLKVCSTARDVRSALLTQPAINPLPNQLKPILGRILVQSNGAIPPDQLNDLCKAVGWSSRTLRKLEKAIQASFRYIAAWHVEREQQQLIGFARAVSDGVYQATLLDIVVHPDFQARGVGKTLVKTLTKQLQAAQIVDITLFASPHVTDFYHQLGFVTQPNNLQWMLYGRTK
ncbi:MAG: GNAT family N-acetyltransferase [Pleurocapsa minor HA4230-MV1]|jgi:tetratricopeptide (TPR) repeat protein|nr:GNAT family N-acetyltransferase [Pleurocapsa minor HA4230-MV1]